MHGRIDALNGLRGAAALWVLVGHAALLCRWQVPMLPSASYAVDLFIMLSGFLMAFHHLLRRDKEPWQKPSIWIAFWIRRFFRIAPTYYVLLLFAIAAGPVYGVWRDQIAAAFPETATAASRYSDQGWDNLLAHLTFVFGIWPHYAFRTALPDWSIGLEMQFYLVFPLLMAAFARTGIIAGMVALLLLSAASWTLGEQFMGLFPMPSFLPLRIHLFGAGILLATAYFHHRPKWWLPLLLSITVSTLPDPWGYHGTSAPMRAGLVIVLAMMVMPDRLPKAFGIRVVAEWCSRLLGARVCQFTADTSYGVYLIHLLVMLPVAAWIARSHHNVDGVLRFAACCSIVIPLSYGLAWLMHCSIERAGIRLGHQLAQRPRQQSIAVKA